MPLHYTSVETLSTGLSSSVRQDVDTYWNMLMCQIDEETMNTKWKYYSDSICCARKFAEIAGPPCQCIIQREQPVYSITIPLPSTSSTLQECLKTWCQKDPIGPKLCEKCRVVCEKTKQ
jgi:hypothetical protein